MIGPWRIGALLLALVLVAGPGGANPHSPQLSVSEALALMLGPPDALTPIPAACCKVCSKGKACGDSCIARDKTCRKGVGCACDR